MKTKMLLVFLIFNSLAKLMLAQTPPYVVKVGETKEIKPTDESLFVISKSQMITLQDSSNELGFARKKISLLEVENSLQVEKEKFFIRDTVIYNNLYHHYYSLWDSTDHKLEATEIKLVRAEHSKWNLGFTGMLIGVIATLLIVK